MSCWTDPTLLLTPFLFAKRFVFYQIGRTVSEENSSEVCELMLCGSRGVGGVATMSDEGLISMDLLDLEDDEEEDDEDDDEASY